MARVRVITDSAASLPPELAAEHGITVIPLNVQIGMESYVDGVNISHEDFYARLEQGDLPTTSQPAPGVVAEYFQKLKNEADAIIAVLVMGRASGTIGSAQLATTLCPDQEISVFDSEAVSMGEGFLALVAAQAAALGAAREEILHLLEDARKRVHVFAALPGVQQLVRSGRVTKGQGLLASLLAIKPVLKVSGGAVEVIDKVRTFPRATERVVELVEQAVGKRRVRLAVLHTNAFEEARAWLEKIRDRFDASEVFIVDAGPILAVHAGTGVLGIAALEE